jgi:hypothetical protein
MESRTKQMEGDVATLTVRVPRAIVSDIDWRRTGRAVRVPRNAWILEAITEKLRRERANEAPVSAAGVGDGAQ